MGKVTWSWLKTSAKKPPCHATCQSFSPALMSHGHLPSVSKNRSNSHWGELKRLMVIPCQWLSKNSNYSPRLGIVKSDSLALDYQMSSAVIFLKGFGVLSLHFWIIRSPISHNAPQLIPNYGSRMNFSVPHYFFDISIIAIILYSFEPSELLLYEA